MRTMSPEHKEKLRLAREASRARKTAVNAEIIEDARPTRRLDEIISRNEAMATEESRFADVDPRDAELEALRERVAEFESKREKAAHEHKTMTGREKVNDPGQIGGAQADVKESLRELIREQMAETFPERQPVRKTARDTARPGAVVAAGRDGEPLYRKRSATADPFAIPEDLQDPQWDRAWIRVSTLGQEDTSNQVARLENGWRFINSDRPGFSGRFMPPNYKGHIFKDGLALVERPMALSEEARRESSQAVRDQSMAQRQQFGMALPPGFSADTAAARQYTFARQGKAEATPSDLRPSLQPSIDIDH